MNFRTIELLNHFSDTPKRPVIPSERSTHPEAQEFISFIVQEFYNELLKYDLDFHSSRVYT